MKHLLIILSMVMLLSACSGNEEVADRYPNIYPDYINVTIPPNIAPLNFFVRDASRVRATVAFSESGNTTKIDVRGSEVRFPIRKWKRLLQESRGGTLTVEVQGKVNGRWVRYKPFEWKVAKEEIDACLNYRLIEPGYEVWNKLQVVERDLTTFSERVLVDNNLTGNSCVNCHVYGGQSGDLSMVHIRGKNGGTMLNRNGRLRKLDTKAEGMISSAVYGNFHPNGKYAVFSTNIIIPGFHSKGSERLEVYDTASDLVVIDLDADRVITKPFVSDTLALETFPVFSADGRKIYFCRAPAVKLPEKIKQLKYSICSIGFDAATGQLADKIDTVWSASKMNASASFPRVSPEGRRLLFTVSDYGTFPIWHREADLRMLDFVTGKVDSLKKANAYCSDTYHSWSSNSHWFVFASKRDDGIYGKPYFCYVDRCGRASKPFVLPQRNPRVYDHMLKSFNIPELSATPALFNLRSVTRTYGEAEAERMN